MTIERTTYVRIPTGLEAAVVSLRKRATAALARG